MTYPTPRQLGTCQYGVPRPLAAARQYSSPRQYGASCPNQTTRRGREQPQARTEFGRRWPAHARAARLPGDGGGDATDRDTFYQRLRREHGPVAPVLLDGGVPAWLVLGYREVVYVASTPTLFARDSRIWNAWDLVPTDWPLQPVVGYRPSLRNLDGPAHERRLGALNDVLSVFAPHDLRARTARFADRLIDAIAGHGAAELMAEYANPLPLLVTAQMSGLPGDQLASAIGDLTLMLNGGTEALDAQARVHAMLTRVVGMRRADPGHDLVSELIAHPAELTDTEIVEDLLVAMTAGQAPTADWIGNTLRLMFTDARFAVNLAGGRRSVGHVMAAALWEDPPIQNLVARWARRDIRLGGRWIREGDLVVFGLSAANTDPRARPRLSGGPAGNHAHLAFGHGSHRCPYAAQESAEIIAATAIEVLLDRLPDLDLAVAPRELVWRGSMWERGLAGLPVRFTPS